MKVLMMVYNTFEHDSRVDRAARTLVSQGNQVTVFCLHREGLPRREKIHGYEVVRCDLKALQAAESARKKQEANSRRRTETKADKKKPGSSN